MSRGDRILGSMWRPRSAHPCARRRLAWSRSPIRTCFSGGTLIIDHGHHLSSSFLHLSKLHVQTGDRVEKGDLIAEVGATGRVTGAHLDWRMNLRDRYIDPQLLVPAMPESAQSASLN